jgi:hypothetical protein
MSLLLTWEILCYFFAMSLFREGFGLLYISTLLLYLILITLFLFNRFYRGISCLKSIGSGAFITVIGIGGTGGLSFRCRISPSFGGNSYTFELELSSFNCKGLTV